MVVSLPDTESPAGDSVHYSLNYLQRFHAGDDFTARYRDVPAVHELFCSRWWCLLAHEGTGHGVGVKLNI